MPNYEFGTLASHGIAFQEQIRRKRRAADGGMWTWEGYLPGPMSVEDASIVCRIAGCWCYDPSKDSVKFYTNQNHTEWRSYGMN